jgi:hypothetical protein
MKSIPFYSSVHDLPCYNWNKVYNQGQLQYLTKNLTIPNSDKFEKMYYKIFQSSIDEFGLPNDAKMKIELRKKALKHYLKFIRTSNFNEKLKADLIMNDLESDKESKSIEFHEQITAISKYMGVVIDPKRFTAYQYLSALNTIANNADRE